MFILIFHIFLGIFILVQPRRWSSNVVFADGDLHELNNGIKSQIGHNIVIMPNICTFSWLTFKKETFLSGQGYQVFLTGSKVFFLKRRNFINTCTSILGKSYEYHIHWTCIWKNWWNSWRESLANHINRESFHHI